METLHDLLGPTQSILILGIITLVLVFLIVKAINQGKNQQQPVDDKNSSSAITAEPVTSHAAPVKAPLATPEARQSNVDSVTPVHIPSAETKQSVKAKVFDGPEDSVLRRHYLAEKAAKKAILANPIPTDSILRRHYEALQQPIVVNRPKKTSTIEQAISKDTRPVPASAVTKTLQSREVEVAENKGKTPEDSVLKRHFIGQIQADILSGFSARPTDSVLRRHYDHQVELEIKKRLAG